MMNTSRKAMLCLLLATIACSPKAISLTKQEQQKVTALTAELKTHCLGRFLLDLPSEAFVSPSSVKVNGITIIAEAMSQEAYEKSMTERQKELETTIAKDYRFLWDSGEAWSAGTRYFLRLNSANDITDAERIIETYKWSKGFRIKAEIYAEDEVSSTYFRKYPPGRELTKDVIPRMREVFRMLERLEGRADDEIPDRPGFCFRGGFIPGKAMDSEQINYFFVMKSMPDVTFSFYSSTAQGGPKSLLQRSSEINASMANSPEAKTLRKGPVPIENMERPEEWLVTMIMTGTTILGHLFNFEANTITGSEQTPSISFDMENGSINKYSDPSPLSETAFDKASLTESEAIAIWDIVSRSLRPRPNGF
jgi:hypothetical protein